MAEFKLDRIRYRWKGEWVASANYIPDDIISYNGKVYTCLTQHTADIDFYSDLNFLNSDIPPALEPRWELMIDGISWLGEWTPDTFYPLGSIVKYNAITYIATTEHLSSTGVTGFDSDTLNWSVYISSNEWLQNWQISTYYSIGDVVKYAGIVYRCNSSHTSASTLSDGLEVNSGSWTLISFAEVWEGDWQINTRYHANDVVRYNGIVYRCTSGHTSATVTMPDPLNPLLTVIDQDASLALGLEYNSGSWEIVHIGLEYTTDWAADTRYKLNDIVKYGASLWICTQQHTSIISFDVSNWDIYTPGFEYEATWTSTTIYQPGDVVAYGGYQYVSKTVNNNATPSLASTDWDILTLGSRVRGEWAINVPYLVGDLVRREGQLYVALADSTGQETSIGNATNSAYWELVVPGEKWQGIWQANSRVYHIGDMVTWAANVYRCISTHASTILTRPDTDTDVEYWTPHTLGTSSNRLREIGDIKTFGIQEDDSSIGTTNLPIGNSGEVLKVVDGQSQWSLIWESDKLYYVSPNGVDDANHGTTLNSPWRTIRYACENVTGPAAILVKTGTYNEVLPIRVPANVSIVGDEIREVIIKPADTIIPATDVPKTVAAIEYIKNSLIQTIIKKTTLTTQFTLSQRDTSAPAGSDASVIQIQSLMATVVDVINNTSNPTILGTVTPTADTGTLQGIQQVINNKQFIINEAVAYIQTSYPFYTFNSETCIRDLGLFIDAMLYDMQYTGTWKTIEAARYYANAADGDRNARQSMFLMRDATGLRNVTCAGLIGDFTDIDQYYLRRVDGGAFVALDPGWGPADESTWITTRSPYLQNITNFGTRCVGMRIEGNLHNGGLKSMVANDFTQVLDDGIGAWVTSDAKTELVSVFTYYNYIGYLAEDGGKIRATNGNNSYGNYGSVSLGSNLVETPITATVNNRYSDATIQQALCFEGAITKLFFANAGTNYTQATYSIVGSGINAILTANEFRDLAVYEARIVDRGDSTNLGGLGYTFNIGQAQQGNTQVIRLASQNSASAADYEGLRLFIESGTGAGQYGYIAAFDTVSKDAYIAQEHTTPVELTETNNSGNVITASDTSELKVDQAVVLSGTPMGGLLYGTIYYIKDILSQTSLTLKDDVGNIILVSNTTGSMMLHALGFEHVVTGAAIAPTLNTTTQYYIEPRVTFSKPSTSIVAGTLSSSRLWSSVAYGKGVYVAVAPGSTGISYSSDGANWTPASIGVVADWASVAYGNGRFVAVASNDSYPDVNAVTYSLDGIQWYGSSLPEATYSSVVYGDYVDTWVAVATGGRNAAYSTDGGITWNSATLPEGADWIDVVYGNGKFVAIAQSDSTATQLAYSADGITWTSSTYVGAAEQIAFGNGRFVIVTGDVTQPMIYSFDGITWENSVTLSADPFDTLTYGAGTFLAAISDTTIAAVSTDGINWKPLTLPDNGTWISATYGNGKFVLIAGRGVASTKTMVITTGTQAQGRATVVNGKVSAINLWEPGSGYTTDPTITLTDPKNIADVAIDVRVGNGVLASPTITNPGSGYFTSTTDITISGDGYQDSYQLGKYITVDNLTRAPRPGDNLFFDEINDYTYRILQVEIIAGTVPSLTARLTIAKELGRAEALEHGDTLTIRQRYSQVRITGHDFLDIGLGNFFQTNYPQTLYPNGSVLAPEHEFVEGGGGRVFYTSTDQDGNFRVGELFAVEQSTGTVTLSADFFQLEGLEELVLGGISAGGTGVVIREFSTDTKFTADSNNIVPTQRAIKAYVANRVSGGGSDAKTNIALSGIVRVGPDSITTTTGTQIDIPVKVNFTGGIDGDLLALSFYMNHGDQDNY